VTRRTKGISNQQQLLPANARMKSDHHQYIIAWLMVNRAAAEQMPALAG
jgi:hypothetical protein